VFVFLGHSGVESNFLLLFNFGVLYLEV